MPDASPSARILVRASARGPTHAAGHPYNPRAEVHGWPVSRLAGLARIAVNLVWLPPGRESCIFHVHHREEEWVHVLEGRGVVELDDAEHELGPGDFVAFPPGVAHQVRNPSDRERLLLLVGGEIIPDSRSRTSRASAGAWSASASASPCTRSTRRSSSSRG